MNGGCVQRLQHSSRGGEGSEQKNNGPGRKEQEDENQSMAQRRLLRFQYRNLKSSIAGKVTKNSLFFLSMLNYGKSI